MKRFTHASMGHPLFNMVTGDMLLWLKFWGTFKVFNITSVCLMYHMKWSVITFTIGPCREKTGLRGVQQSEFQTSPLSYRD